MLTRFVRIQLTIFAVASVIGLVVMVLNYLQVPRLMGIGHLTVSLELPASGGLYRFGNVTYRGVQVGKVTDVKVVDGRRVVATLSLDTSPKIPSRSAARVRSVSAVGEQYVDLVPPSDAGPYLADGSVIKAGPDALPQQVGPMLDQLNGLVKSIPQGHISTLLDESYHALNGAGYDFGSLADSFDTIADRLSPAADQTRLLVDDSGPLLDGQAESASAIRTWARSLAGITTQLVQDDSQFRTLLHNGSGAANEASRLLTQVKPTLPLLLANLTTVGQIGVTYHPSVEQLLILLPPNVSNVQAYLPGNNPDGMATGDFAVSLADPPACTVGFLPPSQWRSPADTTTVDTPDGLYCKLPQDSPIAVRGARNYPCMGHPGKRAPTVQICDSDQPYMPLAMRQHVLGPYPLDPNLIAQGVPVDTPVDPDRGLYGPLAGTPMPAGAPPALSGPPPPATSPVASPPPAGGIAPSAYNGAAAPGPSVAVVHYDPHTGAYLAPDGQMYLQSDLTTLGSSKTLQDLMVVPG
jgi:virulence factor Mce-like protein